MTGQVSPEPSILQDLMLSPLPLMTREEVSMILPWRIDSKRDSEIASRPCQPTQVTQSSSLRGWKAICGDGRQSVWLGASLVAQMVKVSACSVGDPGSIPGSGRSPGEGNGNPLQYSCLENFMDGGA